MAKGLVLFILATLIVSGGGDVINFEERLSRILDTGYCQASAQKGLSEIACQAKKWDDIAQLALDRVRQCVGLQGGETHREDILHALSRNTTWLSLNNVKALIATYIDTCLTAPSAKLESIYADPKEDPCTSEKTRNLTQWWRQDNEGSNIKPANGYYNCDKDLQSNKIWFRIQGAAGTHLQTKCVPNLSCGSHGGFWTDVKMPTKVGQIQSLPIYGSLYGNCTRYIWPTKDALTVKRCSMETHDLVYKIHGTEECYWSVCGEE